MKNLLFILSIGVVSVLGITLNYWAEGFRSKIAYLDKSTRSKPKAHVVSYFDPSLSQPRWKPDEGFKDDESDKYARTHSNIIRDFSAEYRKAYEDIPPLQFMKVHISDKQYRDMSVLGEEMDWVMTWRNENRRWHDREVHFGNLQYCKNYIVYTNSNPLPSTTSLHPTIYYIRRKRLKPYCTVAHLGNGTTDKTCPPLEMDCTSSCLTITCAVLKHQPERVKKLVEAGEDVNQIIWDDAHLKYTTLPHGAIHMGDMDLIHFLIERGVDLEIKDQSELTLLFYSAKQMRDTSAAIVKLLLESGAKMEINKGGKLIVFEDWVEMISNTTVSDEIRQSILRMAAEHRKKNGILP